MRRLGLSAVAVFIVATILAATAVGQEVRPASADPALSFKTAARLVNVSVVVTDPQGKAITGLTKEDFELFDNGNPQPIRFFQAIENAPSRPNTLPPNTYTNRLTARGAPPNLTALLIDLQHSDWAAQNYSLHHLRAFLRELRVDDRIAIYLLSDTGFKVLHDFTQDSSDLIAAVQRYDAQHSGPKPEGAKPQAMSGTDIDRFLAGGDIEFRFGQWQPAIGANIAPGQGTPGGPNFPIGVDASGYRDRGPRVRIGTALSRIGRVLATAKGRKSLIWIYGGAFDVASSLLPEERDLQITLARSLTGSCSPQRSDPPCDSRDRALRDVRAGHYPGDVVPLLIRLFNDNGIAVYPVDAGGLQSRTGSDPLGFKNPDATTLPDIQQALNTTGIEAHQHMMSIAARTGGRAYYNRNDLETGIQRAVRDAEYSYELAYYPDHNDWRGEWRKIEITLKHPLKYVESPAGTLREIKNLVLATSGPQVLARGGYYAFPEAKVMARQNTKRSLEQLAVSPLELPEIPITVKMTPSPGSESPPVVEARVLLSAQNVFVNQLDLKWKSNFEVLFFQLTAKNVIADVSTQNVDIELNDVQHSDALRRGIKTVAELRLKPGATLLSVIVHDKNTDAVGSVRIPLEQYSPALMPAGASH